MTYQNTKKRPAKVEKNIGTVPAEFTLVGLILLEQYVISYCDELDFVHFSNYNMGKLFEIAHHNFKAQKATDTGTLHPLFEKELHQDEEAMEIMVHALDCTQGIDPSPTNIKTLIETIKRKFSERQVAAAAETLGDIARNDGISVEEKIETARRQLDDAERLTAGPTKLVTAAQMIEMSLQKSEETRAAGTIPGISTGFKDLDSMTSGFASAELIILAARPSMGKTALALCFAHAAVVNESKAVLMISLEMDATQIGPRWISLISDVRMSSITKGRLSYQEKRDIQAAQLVHADDPLFIDETPAMTLAHICNRARTLHAQTPGGLDMLIVDYLQLITDSGRQGANKAELVGEISRGLKQLSRELKIPVVALSQLNRDLEKRQDKRPQMSDLRDSGAIEQDADVIIFLYRDEVYNKQSIDVGRAEIIVAKQRKGLCGTIIVGFDGSRSRFFDLDESITSQTSQIIKSFEDRSGSNG